MAFTSYTTLKAAIADWLNRTDLTAAIPDFISLLEAELDRNPAISYERSNETFTLSGSPHTLPTDCRELRSLYYDDGVRFGEIDIVPEGDLPRYRAHVALTGFPRAAAVVNNGTALLLAPVPDQAYTARATYLTKLEKLSATVATNWVLDSHPDVYLYGALVQSAPYLKNDERLALWQSRYAQYDAQGNLAGGALRELERFLERRKWGANTLVQRPRRPIGRSRSSIVR
jgi:hypothetical protein